MSAVVMRTVRRWWGLALPIVVVAALAGIVLVAGAATGDKAGPSEPSSDPRGVVTDAGVNPWEANDPALVPKVDSTAGFATGYGVRR